MNTDELGKDVLCRIENSARRLDRVYGCCGNEVAAIKNELTHAALSALAEYREGGAA